MKLKTEGNVSVAPFLTVKNSTIAFIIGDTLGTPCGNSVIKMLKQLCHERKKEENRENTYTI